MNIASKWELPLLIVIENNKMVFSTENYVIELDKNFKVQNVKLEKNWIGDISLHRAMDMRVIKEAIENVIN